MKTIPQKLFPVPAIYLLRRAATTLLFAIFIMFFTFQGYAQTFNFFRINSVKLITTPPLRGKSIFDRSLQPGDENSLPFSPYLEITVRTEERTRATAVYAKVYYFDGAKKQLLDKSEKPFTVLRGSSRPHGMPVFFEKRRTETLYFVVPPKVLAAQEWRGVVVFGDSLAATASVYPSGFVNMYDFPERSQVDKPVRLRREAITDPVIEHVVRTGNTRQPQITLFMRPPIGMTNMAEANGVLAICLLANSVEEIKRRLQEAQSKDDVSGILRYAEKQKLVILCWGSRSLWDTRRNWDELDQNSAKHLDRTFDDVAAAWERGVGELSQRYGMPDREFLLWGFSGAAQYAKRLALRKPQYFLAVHIHIPSSFDKPTTEAAQVLWCLTTGEVESGYERSLRFLAECRKMGYPIIYKAIPGLGHQGHPATDRLGTHFFDYALTLRDEKHECLESLNSPSVLPWPKSFREPEYIADVMNQQIFSPAEAENCVPAFRINIPTKNLADAWQKEK